MSDELIALALLVVGEKGPVLHISKNRQKLLRKILKEGTFKGLKRHLKSLENDILQYQEKSEAGLLFNVDYTIQQLSIIAKKSQHSIRYAQPITISEDVDKELVERLVETMFGEEP